jgi:ketopantoate reductase
VRVAILGAGALGSLYGARLATAGDCDVVLVARSPRPAARLRVEVVNREDVIHWDMPECRAAVPADVDVTVACVRYEQLGELGARLAGSRAPVAVLTPMMPQDHRTLSGALGERLLVGMPGAVAYRNEAGILRCWLPRLATTWIEGRDVNGAEMELVRCLVRSGIAAQMDRGILARNVATTVSMLPMALALDCAGSLDRALEDGELVSLALDAAEEGRALARMIGKPATWTAALTPMMRPLTLKVGLAIARSRAAEAVRYAEEHFGRKLRGQNMALGRAVLELAVEKGARRTALEGLMGRLVKRRPTP